MMTLSNIWKKHFISQPGSNNANRNLEAFKLSELEKLNNKEKIKVLMEEEDLFILSANNKNKFSNFHSPKYFGRTRLRKKNKVAKSLAWVQR